MRSYESARNLFSFLGFCSGALILLGIVAALGGASLASTMSRGSDGIELVLGAIPGILLAMLGFYGQAMVQMGRAGVDTAEYSQQALKVARDQLEVSKQVLAQGKQMAMSYAMVAQKPAAAGAGETGDEAPDTGPSYADRPAHTAALSVEEEKTAIKPEPPEPVLEAASGLPQLEHKNGAFKVGDRTFQSEAPAKNYLADLERQVRAEQVAE